MAIRSVHGGDTNRKPVAKKSRRVTENKKRNVRNASKRTVRLPKAVKTKSSGILENLFGSDRTSGEIDYTFLLLVGVLTVFGLVMLLSASTPAANVKFGNSYHFFLRQFIFVALGAVLMFTVSRIDYRKFKPYARIFMIVCIGLLVMVFVPKIGVEHNGSRRWINLIFMEFQPSEITKLAIAMFFAAAIEEKRYNLRNMDGILRIGAWIGVVAILMMLETHMSGTIVLCGIAFCIMLIGGVKMSYVWTAGGFAAVAAAVFLAFNPVRMARITSFLDPFADKRDKGFQIIQSLYAIGSGGIFGKGIGQSMQKFYVPEPYNDFIFAIVCEELGFVGAAFIIFLFAALLLRGIKIALEAQDTFGSLMVVGIMSQVAIQTVLNIAVVTSSIPNTGVPLPFFSYGGTAIMILLLEMGFVLSVSRFSKKNIQ